ncbi:hypothetical protein GQ600_10465 [Phytophthora cactorum]|nr:hypothetical protein GQ600_10465 [Phytophthora cactorum]
MDNIVVVQLSQQFDLADGGTGQHHVVLAFFMGLDQFDANVMGSSSSTAFEPPDVGRGSKAAEWDSALNTMPYVPSPILPRMRYLSVRLSGRRNAERLMVEYLRVKWSAQKMELMSYINIMFDTPRF